MTIRRTAITLIVRALRPNVLRAQSDCRKFEKELTENVHRMQLRKLQKLLKHHLKRRFYRDYCMHDVKLTSLDALKSFPIVTKDFLREHVHAIGQTSEAYRYDSTSGSSGKNLFFYQNRGMLDASTAAVRYCTLMAGVDIWCDRTIGIWGHSPSTDWKADTLQTLKRVAINTELLQGYGLNSDRAAKYLDKISRVKPKLLYGYPSYLHFLARVGLNRNIRAPELGSIICSGEQLQEDQKLGIESYFGTTLFNRYGSREFGIIAHETFEHAGMYVPPTRFILEVGSEGELLVTDLDNMATPFIRYAIGDVAELVDASKQLGRPGQCIASIHGRTHDIIKTPSGKMIPGQFWTLLSRVVPGIQEFQIVQTTPKTIEFRLIAGRKYKPENEYQLKGRFGQLVGDEVTLLIRPVDKIERSAMGKRRFIIRIEDNHDSA
ncbi:MAG: hypothetical protein PHQ11_01615 [Paludibacter sp.]|nr:hypothetical protein [Paludibacter sp.]MDD4072531.1 hypothetical protein [Desulfobacterales bacterium]MDD4428541.1 hypothetical protein [Paludibacter sp.]